MHVTTVATSNDLSHSLVIPNMRWNVDTSQDFATQFLPDEVFGSDSAPVGASIVVKLLTTQEAYYRSVA